MPAAGPQGLAAAAADVARAAQDAVMADAAELVLAASAVISMAADASCGQSCHVEVVAAPWIGTEPLHDLLPFGPMRANAVAEAQIGQVVGHLVRHGFREELRLVTSEQDPVVADGRLAGGSDTKLPRRLPPKIECDAWRRRRPADEVRAQGRELLGAVNDPLEGGRRHTARSSPNIGFVSGLNGRIRHAPGLDVKEAIMSTEHVGRARCDRALETPTPGRLRRSRCPRLRRPGPGIRMGRYQDGALSICGYGSM